jgi:SAM-dependent methyltransferase
MDYPDQSFDAVSCISAIEHIPDDGDIMAIKEIGRVLRPGGRAFISVPYAQEFRKGMSHGGHFEMKYDCKALRERLVEPSGLLLEREDFIFDRSSRRVGGLIYYDLPGYARYLLGWTGIPLLVSQVLSYRDKATKSNAQFAWVSLRKIEG